MPWNLLLSKPWGTADIYMCGCCVGPSRHMTSRDGGNITPARMKHWQHNQTVPKCLRSGTKTISADACVYTRSYTHNAVHCSSSSSSLFSGCCVARVIGVLLLEPRLLQPQHRHSQPVLVCQPLLLQPGQPVAGCMKVIDGGQQRMA